MQNLYTLKTLKSHIRILKILGQIWNIFVYDFSVFKVYKLCISWNSKEVIDTAMFNSMAHEDTETSP
jgi:hypothetical protein